MNPSLDYQFIFLLRSAQMEGEAAGPSALLTRIAHSNYTQTITLILCFLAPEELDTLASIALTSRRKDPFFRIAAARVFLHKYVNRVDRGMFFYFYDEEEFKNIEQRTTTFLAINNYHFLYQAHAQFEVLLDRLREEAGAEVSDGLQQAFLEPELPLPTMARETIGMYCQSLFQQFVCRIRFPPEDLDPFLDQSLEQLSADLQEESQALLLDQGQWLNQAQASALHTVRYSGFRVSHANWQQLVIPSCKTHNLILFMLALCAQIARTFATLISDIEDPIMQFVEFTLRSHVYRNIILNVEERYQFLFSNYNNFYNEIYHPPPQRPKFNFWRPALSIWMHSMKQFHPQNAKTFNYLLARLREESLREFLAAKTQKLPSFYTGLKQSIEMRGHSQQRRQQLYKMTGSKCELQTFFQDNIEMYEILVKDYIDYIIDISLNECNVHWCGHSQHVIKKYTHFGFFNQAVIIETQQFYHFVMETLRQSNPKQIAISTLRQVIKEDLHFLNLKVIKPVTVRGVVDAANKFISSQLQKMPEHALFVQEAMNKNRISFDFEQKDNLLAYFAAKAGIEMDCPPNMTFFYNIQQEKEAEFEQGMMEEESESGEGMCLQKYESEASSEHEQ